MRIAMVAAGLLTLGLAVSGCGGGTGSTSPIGNGITGGPPPMVTPSIAPSTAPSSAPTMAPSGAPTVTGLAGDAKQVQLNGGPAWVDAKTGLALYTFDGDTTPNQSNCTGSCLAIWPSHAAASSEKGTNNFTIFTRPEGTLQWAYKGKPLYMFVSDTPSNNGTGEGIQNFHIARP